MNSSLPLGHYLSNNACSGQILVCTSNDLVGRWLAWSLAHRASENEMLLAQKENLCVPDDPDGTFCEHCFDSVDFFVEGEIFETYLLVYASISQIIYQYSIINTQFSGSWEKWDASCSYKTRLITYKMHLISRRRARRDTVTYLKVVL